LKDECEGIAKATKAPDYIGAVHFANLSFAIKSGGLFGLTQARLKEIRSQKPQVAKS
jgi:hypothetical protein